MNEHINTDLDTDLDDEPLRLSAAEYAGRSYVLAEGEIDLYTVQFIAPLLAQTMATATLAGRDAVAGSPPPAVIVDLRRVAFIDSAALALFTGFCTEYRGRCVLALLVTERGQPERALQLAHLHTILPVIYGERELDDAPAASARPTP